MTFLTLKNVMKQQNQKVILKNINLTIDSTSQIGVKMTSEESSMLFELLVGKQRISSGSLEKDTINLVYEIKEDRLYEDFKVKSYLIFFKKISGYKGDLKEHLENFSLLDIWHTKIRDLSIDQKKRVSLFRLYLFAPHLLMIESPLSNLSNEGIELYLKALHFVRSKNIATLFSSNFVEELLLLSKDIFRYSHTEGLEKTDLIENSADHAENHSTEDGKFQPNPIFKVVCKLEDKTIFFSPYEIDSIESINGISTIRIEKEYFPSPLTLNKLEEKLVHFGFFRCHRSYLVNLQRISELISYSRNSYTLILKGNTPNKIPLSRTRLEELKEIIEL